MPPPRLQSQGGGLPTFRQPSTEHPQPKGTVAGCPTEIFMNTREQIEAMSDEERRIKTAELCGWRNGSWGVYARWLHPDGIFRYGQPSDDASCIPDYLNSLDAMAGAEEHLSCEETHEGVWDSEIKQWERALYEICIKGGNRPYRGTARQRNTAFLMVMLP